MVSRDRWPRSCHHPDVATVLAPRAAVPADGRGLDRWLAWAGEAVLVLVATSLVAAFLVAGHDAFDGFIERLQLVALVVAVCFAAVGIAVARRGDATVLALLSIGIAAGFAGALALDRYVQLGAGRDWPGLSGAEWVSTWLWVPAMWAIAVLLPLRFPDGHLVHHRWRPVEALGLTAVTIEAIAFALAPYGRFDDVAHRTPENPFANASLAVPLHRFGVVLGVAALVGAVASAWSRARTSDRDGRALLAWLLLAIVVAATVVAVVVLTGSDGGIASALVASLAIGLVPAAIAVGVVRHGLWDVELVLQRSLAYALVTTVILVGYVAAVVLLGGVLGATTGAPLVATGAVAVGIQPLRDRAQRLANRMVYGLRDDPRALLATVAHRLGVAADRSELLADATSSIVEALRLAGAAVVVDGEVVAAAGAVSSPARYEPLIVGGEQVGELAVATVRGDQLRVRDREALRDLAGALATVVQADRLERELARSRADLVAAREEERRRIRRDLHDELGPTLAAIGHEIDRAALTVPPDAQAALDRTAERVRGAVGSVREVVDGLRPAALDDLGLRRSVEQLLRGLESPTGPSLSCRFEGDLADLPAAVDAAAYRIVAEAVTNAIRHAGAAQVLVAVEADEQAVRVRIDDDGRGGARPGGTGVGLASMRERASEVGGVFELAPRPGGGTSIAVSLPRASGG